MPRYPVEGHMEDIEPSLEEIQEEVLRSQQYEGDLPDPFDEVLGG